MSGIQALGKLIAISVAPLVAQFLFAASARSQPPGEVARDLVHSDLPIFGHGADNEWPQHFLEDDSFGCASRVAFGDWALRERGATTEDDVQWFRFSNYGVFHCWVNVFRASERAKLEGAEFLPSFFVFLGRTRVNDADVELWVVQIGAKPGSEYLLLSRNPGKGLIDKFSVLQTECSRDNVRDAGSLDIVPTRYCAINARDDLIRFANRMAQWPPLGTLALVSHADGKDNEADQ